MLKIGIDLDDCINYRPDFFRLMTNAMKDTAEIHIITNRDKSPESQQQTAYELESLGIHYTHLEITGEKAKYIMDKGISVYFDDTDEYYQNLPESVFVLKVREPGSFDFDEHKWVYSKKTGIDIDD